jgi:methylated-DNA-protein-cysteine methyltransferase-like protein
MTSSFFERVYQVVRLIPPGKVATYGQIARLLEAPHAARTVGWAMASSRDDDVPWQRVVNAQGRISGARRVESGRQRELLEAEGVVFDEDGRIDLTVYQWEGWGILPPHLVLAPSDLDN